MLAADLERVAESLAGQQRGRRALALDQRIRDQGGAVDDLAQASIAAFADASVSSSPASMATEGSSGGRQRLADDERAGGIVIDDEIGEGAADIDAGARDVTSRVCSSSRGGGRSEPSLSASPQPSGGGKYPPPRLSTPRLLDSRHQCSFGNRDGGKISAAGERIGARMPPSTAINCPVT